jgi:hypothetical protein
MILAVAVVTDSSILVVGAMVVGPEFGVVAALAVGIALRTPGLDLEVGAVAGLGVPAGDRAHCPRRAAGPCGRLDRCRQCDGGAAVDRVHLATGQVVAVLAGCAGVLSQTAGRANALVGVFISVTTVPAAGDLALSVALWAPHHIGGAAAQLGINLAGMTLAGVVTLLLQRVFWRIYLVKGETGAGARVEA